MDRETIRQQYVSHRDADLARQGREEKLDEYMADYKKLNREEQTQEARRLYETGVKIGKVLFNAASPGVDEVESTPLLIYGNVRSLSLPALGSFVIMSEDEETDQPSYVVATDTNRGIVNEDDRIADINPQVLPPHRQIDHIVLAYLRLSLEALDVLRQEAGLPKVKALELAATK